MWLTSPGFWSWTSGRVTPMDGKRSLDAKRCEAADTTRRSLTRDIASMLVSGRSKTVRCEAYTGTIVCTRALQDGKHSNHRCRGQRKWTQTPFGSARPRFRKNGTKEIETV